MFKNILCPTDFSDNSVQALRYAKALADANDATIDCLNVIDLGHNLFGPVEGVYVSAGDVHKTAKMIEDHAHEQMNRLVKKEHFLGVELKPHYRKGNAAEEVVTAAEQFDSDLIVLATHGRHGIDRMLFGSTCDGIVRRSTVPVLAIKTDERDFVQDDGSIKLKRILCPVDFSDFSTTALPQAQALARQFGATILLAHIVDARLDYPEWTAQASVNNSDHLVDAARQHLHDVANEMDGIETEIEVAIGIAHTTLCDLVNRKDIDLVVMPTHGRKGVAHAILGSVAEKVARMANCPVLTVRPKE